MSNVKQTIEAWVEEFCPVDSNHVKTEDMGEWLSRKWKGARPENLAEYGLTKVYTSNRIEDSTGNVFGFNTDTCPWCMVAKRRFEAEHGTASYDDVMCPYCPAIVAGMRKCDGTDGAYSAWTGQDDPEPMIKWIDEANIRIAMQSSKKKRQEQEDAKHKYPECEKVAKHHKESQAIGDFLDWLASGAADSTRFKRGVFLAARHIVAEEWRRGEQTLLEDEDCYLHESKITSWSYDIQRLLAKYFGIDLDKHDKEQRAILEDLRKADNEEVTN